MFPPEFVPAGQCPVHQVDGVEVAECSAAEYLEAMNGRLTLKTPHVRGEHKVEMRGTAPESWGLL